MIFPTEYPDLLSSIIFSSHDFIPLCSSMWKSDSSHIGSSSSLFNSFLSNSSLPSLLLSFSPISQFFSPLSSYVSSSNTFSIIPPSFKVQLQNSSVTPIKSTLLWSQNSSCSANVISQNIEFGNSEDSNFDENLIDTNHDDDFLYNSHSFLISPFQIADIGDTSDCLIPFEQLISTIFLILKVFFFFFLI
jgi:hypothetical protein